MAVTILDGVNARCIAGHGGTCSFCRIAGLILVFVRAIVASFDGYSKWREGELQWRSWADVPGNPWVCLGFKLDIMTSCGKCLRMSMFCRGHTRPGLNAPLSFSNTASKKATASSGFTLTR